MTTAEAKRALQLTYEAEVKCRPDGRWSYERLDQELRTHRMRVLEVARQNAEVAQKKAKAEELRQARITERGEFETFVKRHICDDATETVRLVRAIRWASDVLMQHKAITAKFTKDLEDDPVHALSWSLNYFNHAGNYTVAQQLKGLFDGGASVDGMINVLSRDMRNKASYPARSTSPTSNLVEQEHLRALTTVLSYLDGDACI